ncbi:Uncharacterised protein [Proteus mirabilis]|uniref:Uncharacterized protein n=1 Tax=Proteus mirabilis TaxID=584 RepID=A0A379GDF1_PROMI|nr:Uncharacterised protein [Proteus mirabilis]
MKLIKPMKECWIGKQGYTKADGSQQRWAIAFIGDTVSESGEKVADIFLVDLPDDDHAFSLEGDKPLAGTETTMPAPAQGIEQIRLTNTHHRKISRCFKSTSSLVKKFTARRCDCFSDER